MKWPRPASWFCYPSEKVPVTASARRRGGVCVHVFAKSEGHERRRKQRGGYVKNRWSSEERREERGGE